MVMGGLSCVGYYYLYNFLKNQHSLKPKTTDGLEKRQAMKTFEDIGGCSQAKESILEVIDYIRDPEYFKSLGVRMPKGVLMYGPPGTGKTLIAKAAATEAGIPMIYDSGSAFVEIYVGLGAKRIRDLFNEARQFKEPCMIFIDEIDAIGYKRQPGGLMGHANREQETALN